jgi:hypothetical protein
MSRIPAVHFGPGRLGLGLIVDILLETGSYDVYLVGAPGREPAERDTYFLRFTDPAYGLRERHVIWAGNPEGVSDLPEGFLDLLRGDGPMLFTAALGGAHVDKACGLIAELLRHRPVRAETALLACENEEYGAYDDMQRTFPHVVVRHCVVDRICAWDPRRSQTLGRRILVHEVAQWVIPRAGSGAIEGLRPSQHVVPLVGDADGYRDRKLWVVNGIHLVLATIARREGVDRLPLTGARELAFREYAKPLAMAMLETADRRHALPVDEAFADDRVRAFCEAPDSATRILSERYLRSDLRPFIQRLDTRLANAARAASECGVPTEPCLWAFREIVAAIRTSNSFLDVSWADPSTSEFQRFERPPAIDEIIDQEVAEMFAGALDWAPESDARVLRRRVVSALAAWRDV